MRRPWRPRGRRQPKLGDFGVFGTATLIELAPGLCICCSGIDIYITSCGHGMRSYGRDKC